jgi:peptide deformylase
MSTNKTDLMAQLKIKVFPDPALRVKAGKVTSVGPEERRILEDMAETMYLNQGVGLAATQVGIAKRLIVIDVGEGLLRFVNPAISARTGTEVSEEGCLSVPGECIKVKRARSITVDFLDEHGTPSSIKCTGLMAKAIQHEIDHLSGKLIVDYLNPIKKFFARSRSCKRI